MQPSVPVKRLRSCQVDDATNDSSGCGSDAMMDGLLTSVESATEIRSGEKWG